MPAAVLSALLTLAFPALASAQQGGGSPPAGGGETGQVIGGTIAAALITAGMLALVIGHRRGRLQVVDRAGALAERMIGVPAWSALPLAVISGSLVTAVFGMYWDISTHIDAGRDPGPFANASHYFILAGLFGIFFAGLLAITMPKERPGPAAIRIREGWQAPVGGLLIIICSAIALSAFPLDDMWHRIFGQDVTLWGPTHLLLFGGAALTTLGAWVLYVEGLRARPADAPEISRGKRLFTTASLGGSFLIALSTFQGEFDFAVPQFRLVWHPILLMLAASIALVTARVYGGRGAALMAAAFFIAVRGILALLVGPTFGHTTLHFPLYLVEAGVVELVALWIRPSRPVRFGAIAGAAIGVFGVAAEWAWSYVWWTIEWPASMLPEAAITGIAMAIAGGVIGGFIGRAVTPEVSGRPAPALALVAAAIVTIAVVAWSTPISEGDLVRAQVRVTEVQGGPERAAALEVRLDPPDAAEDARWFNATAWQGQKPSVVDALEEVAPGVWRTTQPIPVHGNWKVTLRLHKGDAVQGLPVYFPADPAIPVEAIPATATFTREFQLDEKLLQREQKPGVSDALVIIAYLAVLAIAILLVACLTLGLRRAGRMLALDRTPGEAREAVR